MQTITLENSQMEVIVDLLDDYLEQAILNPENFCETPEQIREILDSIARQVLSTVE